MLIRKIKYPWVKDTKTNSEMRMSPKFLWFPADVEGELRWLETVVKVEKSWGWGFYSCWYEKQ